MRVLLLLHELRVRGLAGGVRDAVGSRLLLVRHSIEDLGWGAEELGVSHARSGRGQPRGRDGLAHVLSLGRRGRGPASGWDLLLRMLLRVMP